MPRPPPATPLAGAAACCGAVATVAGRLAGGGNWALSTRLTGAGCTGATAPVTSPDPRFELKGFSPKRVVSLLHPATPRAITISAIACGRDHERGNCTTQD